MSALSQPPDSEAERLLREAQCCLATEVTACNGLKCRELTCESCFPEDDALKAAERGRAIGREIQAYLSRQPAIFSGRNRQERESYANRAFEWFGSLSEGATLDAKQTNIAHDHAHDLLHCLRDAELEIDSLSRQPAAQKERRKGERRNGDLPHWYDDQYWRGDASNPVWVNNQRQADRRQPAAQEPEGQWISVKERLPEDGGDYFVMDCGHMRVGEFYTVTRTWTTDNGDWDITPTHWYPRPAMLRASEPNEGKSK